MRYDYEIIRDEGREEHKTYTPGPIPMELSDIVEIEAPNSSGKSTLLNIIALAFYGLKNDSIDRTLKKEMQNLYESSHQQLSFNLDVETENEHLISEKSIDSQDINVRDAEKDRPLPPEIFQEKYNLIYDIPDEPLNRIEKIAENVEDVQRDYAANVQDLNKEVSQLITEINNTNNEQRLETANSNLESSKSDKRKAETQLRNLKDKKNYLRDYTYSRYYKKYKEDYERKKDQLKSLKEEIEESEGSKDEQRQEVGDDKSSILEDLHKDLGNLRDRRDEVVELTQAIFSEDDQKVKELNNLKLDPSKASNFRFSEDIEVRIEEIREKVEEKKDSIKNQDAYDQANFYKKMYNFLENFKDKKIQLPGGTPVSEFIEELQDEKERYDQLIKEKKKCSQALSEVNKLSERKDEIEETYLKDLRELTEAGKGPSESQSQQRKLETTKESLEAKKEKYEEYKEKYEDRNEPNLDEVRDEASSYVGKWEKLTEEDLKEKIENLERQIDTKQEKIDTLEEKIERFSELKEKLESEEPHEYEEYEEELNELRNTLQDLRNKLSNKFKDYINDITRGEIKGEPDEMQAKYNEAVFSYLGERMGSFQYDDREYQAAKINLIEGKIYAEDGTEIQFQDMGTGHKQSAYLKSLLNTDDDRKIIALFDEVAMMDNESMQPIYDELKKLKNENKLVLAVIVQHTDEELEITQIS